MTQIPLIAGIIASALHVFSGPDHLAAVTPMAVNAQKKVWRIGFTWGLGHLVGMLLIGLLFLAFKEVIPVESISTHSEQLVGVVLIGIGLWTLYKIFAKEKIHSRPHIHSDGEAFVHQHQQAHDIAENHAKYTQHSAFGIGLLHGLAGVAHFLLLLPALGFESTAQSGQYIVGFAIGTVAAMTVYTFLLGKMTQSVTSTNGSLLRGIRVAGGVFALVVGVVWLVYSL